MTSIFHTFLALSRWIFMIYMELHFLTVFSDNPNNPANLISVEYTLNILGARLLGTRMRCKGFALLAMRHSKLSVDQRSSYICTQLFTLPTFRNTSEPLIYFTVVLALQGIPVVSLWHLRLTMADNLLSVDLPPSPLMEAGLSNNNMDNVSRTKSTIKNGQGIIDFMFDDDSTDHKGDTGLSKNCTHPTFTSSPSTLIPASRTHTHVKDHPMTASRTKIRGELTDSVLDKSASDCNNDTMLLDNYLNPILPSPMTAICTSKNKTKDF